MQEVLLAIWQALPTVREHDRLLPFVLRIANNLSASDVRTAMGAPALLLLDPAQHDMPDPATTEGAELARSEWRFAAFVTLPLRLRQPLMLQLEGFDYGENTSLLGISQENVGIRLYRASAIPKKLPSQEGIA